MLSIPPPSVPYQHAPRPRRTASGVRGRLKVLIVDDAPSDRLLYRRLLEEAFPGLEVSESSTAGEAINRARQDPPDCMLLDYQLPDLDGISLMRRLAASTGELPFPVLMITGIHEKDIPLRAVRAGAHALLAKGYVRIGELARVVAAAVDAYSPRRRQVLEAEYAYASVAYTGVDPQPTELELGHFALASAFARLVSVLRNVSLAEGPCSNSGTNLSRTLEETEVESRVAGSQLSG